MWSIRVADSESELNSTISSLDTNNDGLISKSELFDGTQNPQAKNSTNATLSLKVYTKTEKVNILMDTYDKNNDGVLSVSEVKNLLVDLGYSNPSSNDAYWLISLIDTNRDNKISWSELYNGLQ